MAKVAGSKMTALMESGKFDAEWYRKTYADVDLLGMDPAVHYLTYGHLMDRDPGPHFNTRFARIAYGIRLTDEPASKLDWRGKTYGKAPEPDPKRVVKAVGTVSLDGNHDLAIALAEKWLAPDTAHVVLVLRANAAIWLGEADAWQEHVNEYLGHFGAAPLSLGPEGTIFDRLGCAALPPVAGGPLVSVMMPAWNAEKTIRKAAQSILDQTWRNLELLIVDDCSTDSTWSVIQEIAARDDRVRIIRNGVNVGPYVSKNSALTQARGEWITGHDADDWAHPARIERQVHFSMRDGGKPSMVRAVRIKPDGLFSFFSNVNDYVVDGIARTAPISCIFPVALLRERAGFWDSVRFGGDSEMIGRIETMMGESIGVHPIIGMICLDMETSLTNDTSSGVNKLTGLSPVRVAYVNAWRKWHKSAGPENLAIPMIQEVRRFKAPDAMCVAVDDIKANLPEDVVHAAT